MVLDRAPTETKEPTTFPSPVKTIPFTHVEEIFHCQPRTQSIRRGGGEIVTTLWGEMISAIGGQLGIASLSLPPNIEWGVVTVTFVSGHPGE